MNFNTESFLSIVCVFNLLCVIFCKYDDRWKRVDLMKCKKCGSHMSKYSGIAICDNCGRTVTYNYKGDSSNGGSSGGEDGCLVSGLAGCLKYLLYGFLILVGIGVLGIAFLFSKLFG